MTNKKTLQVVICYNMPSAANQLYSSLKPYESDTYDLIMLDNGSPPEGTSKYTNIKLSKNIYFGGGLKYACSLLLNNSDKYDSLLYTINTLTLFGYNWVNALRNVMFKSSNKNVGVVSPSIISNGSDQNAWPQMHNWCLNVPRKVRWVDFQSPLINIDVVKEINEYPNFGIGYGYDVYTGIMCEKMNYNAYVLDYVYAVHQKKQTAKLNKAPMNVNEYKSKSLQGMYAGFKKINLINELNDMRNWASNYKPIEL